MHKVVFPVSVMIAQGTMCTHMYLTLFLIPSVTFSSVVARVRAKEDDIFPVCSSLEKAGFQPLPAYLCDYTGIHADIALEGRGILIHLPEKRLLSDAAADTGFTSGDDAAAGRSIGSSNEHLRRLNPTYLSPGMVAMRRKLHTLAGWRVVELSHGDMRHVESVGFWEEKLGEE